MEYGYVFKVGVCSFGILTYTAGGPRIFIRFTNSTNVPGACQELRGIFAGNFKPADEDQELWARAIFRAQGSIQMLTN